MTGDYYKLKQVMTPITATVLDAISLLQQINALPAAIPTTQVLIW